MSTENQFAESFGMFPKDSEGFGTLPNNAEPFRIVPKSAERTENHVLSVREVARMFENTGVARTERSITNWCRPDPNGVSRLDAYYDYNERRYFITPQSVDRAIQEELAKARPESIPPSSENFGTVLKPQETKTEHHEYTPPSEDTERIKELERQIQDLKFLNQGKDYFIELLQNDRKSVAEERLQFVEKLTNMSHRVGTLEAKLQLEAPRAERIIDTEPITPSNRGPVSVPVRSWEGEYVTPIDEPNTPPVANPDPEQFSSHQV